jgi:SAM-dependent methyltransferase
MSVGPEAQKSRDHNEYFGNFVSLPFERILEKFRQKKSIEILNKLIKSEVTNILEIGPGYNALSAEIFPGSKKTMLEPSTILYAQNVSKFESDPTTTILQMDLNSFSKSVPTEKFDLVILSGVLHEMLNPREELISIHSCLKRNGILFIVTPNNQSIHRLLGVFLGILENTSALTSTEIMMQQHSNYSLDSLQGLLKELDFMIDLAITSFLKPHTHKQMQTWVDEGLLTESKLQSLYELSEIFEPYNSEIFILARKYEI